MGEIILPKAPREVVTKSPKNLIIFSKPKVGKSSLVAQLPNWLLLDLEDGSDFISAMSIKAKSVEEISEIVKKIKEDGYPYSGIAVDTTTALEYLCLPYAEKLYARTSMGKNWFLKSGDKLHPESGKAQYGSIINLPNGAGY